jgi:hypothetical protein
VRSGEDPVDIRVVTPNDRTTVSVFHGHNEHTWGTISESLARVIALRSNIRWCSDYFEPACRNGEILRVLFVSVPAIARSWPGRSASAGISGEMAHALMVACVERRFGISKAVASRRMGVPNIGSTYIAKNTPSSFVSRQSARRDQTASRRHSSKPSNAIMAGCRSCGMLRP